MKLEALILLCGCLVFTGCGEKEDKDLFVLAEAGDAKAQNQLGFLYDMGNELPQSDAKAFGWYLKAAKQGLAKAQFNLGGMYYTGQGIPRDRAEAAKWFKAAGEQGLTQAQLKLGFMYWHVDGVVSDQRAAAYWFEQAAATGDGIARTALAQLNLDE
ncbi:MAG: sel1 repeat family protein [Planctomycetes bacterium]|nr:sel1 repeat family protein [Planctomycetota bacterium]